MKELVDLASDPIKPVDMSAASKAIRERSRKLCGVLAGLLKNRCLQVLRAIEPSDGHEGWGQLLLTLRLTSKNHGLAMMSGGKAWDKFNMQAAIRPQLLRLDEVFAETKRVGANIQEEVRVAVVLRCLGRQLRTHGSLQLDDGVRYEELRECIINWDRARQKWNHLIPSLGEDEDAMNIDRIKGKGKWKGGKDSKGKGKDKK